MITTALEFGFQADHLDSNGITKRNNFKSKKERILLNVKSSFSVFKLYLQR